MSMGQEKKETLDEKAKAVATTDAGKEAVAKAETVNTYQAAKVGPIKKKLNEISDSFDAMKRGNSWTAKMINNIGQSNLRAEDDKDGLNGEDKQKAALHKIDVAKDRLKQLKNQSGSSDWACMCDGVLKILEAQRDLLIAEGKSNMEIGLIMASAPLRKCFDVIDYVYNAVTPDDKNDYTPADQQNKLNASGQEKAAPTAEEKLENKIATDDSITPDGVKNDAAKNDATETEGKTKTPGVN